MKIHHIQWAGQFHVASELSRRGYNIAFTLGNAKATDIIVSTSDGHAFPMEIKTTTRTWWHIKNVPPEDVNRFWAFVRLDSLETMPRTYLAKNIEVLKRWSQPRASGNLPGLKVNQMEDWENRWEILPSDR